MLKNIGVYVIMGIFSLCFLHFLSLFLIGVSVVKILFSAFTFNLFVFFCLPAIIFISMHASDNQVSKSAGKWLAIVYFSTTFFLTVYDVDNDLWFVAWMWPIFFVLKYGFFLP